MSLADKPVSPPSTIDVPERMGITLLEHYAGLAMQGDWAAQDANDLGYFPSGSEEGSFDHRAAEWVKSAQALIAELEKVQKP